MKYNIVQHKNGFRAQGNWEPMDAFNVTNGDNTLITLSQNGVSYYSPVEDPFFLSKTEKNSNGRYSATYETSSIGCMDQYRMCNPNNNQCTEPDGFFRLRDLAIFGSNLEFNDAQWATAERVVDEMSFTQIFWNINRLGDAGEFLLSGEGS